MRGSALDTAGGRGSALDTAGGLERAILRGGTLVAELPSGVDVSLRLVLGEKEQGADKDQVGLYIIYIYTYIYIYPSGVDVSLRMVLADKDQGTDKDQVGLCIVYIYMCVCIYIYINRSNTLPPSLRVIDSLLYWLAAL